MTRSGLLTLHPELQLYIVDRLTSLRDLAALVQTCHFLHATLSPALYRIGHRTDPDLLPWACCKGGLSVVKTVERLLAAGADPAYLQSLPLVRLNANIFAGQGLATVVLHFHQVMQERQRSIRGEICYAPRLMPAGFKPPFHDTYELRVRPLVRYEGFSSTKDLMEFLNGEPMSPDFHIQWSPMHIAACRGHIDILKVLLDHDESLTQIMAAGYCPLQETLPSTLAQRHRIPPTPAGQNEAWKDHHERRQGQIWCLHTPLRAALCAGQEDTAKYLIDRGAKLDFGPGPNGEGEHALHVAASYGCLRILRYLANHPGMNINLNIIDSHGWTPLCHAIISPRQFDTVTCLLDLGADVNTPLGDTSDGFTHLHLACWHRQWSRAHLLVSAGAAVDAIYSPAVPYYNGSGIEVGPFRAIDIICMETVNDPDLLREGDMDEAKYSASGWTRAKLLTQLVKDRGASTGLCPGSKDTPAVLAAKNPSAPIDLLQGLRDAGVFFHNEEDIVVGAFEDLGDPDLDEEFVDDACEVAEWLLRNGARVQTDESGTEVLSRGFKVLCEFASGYKPTCVGLLPRLLQAGMDPNLPAAKVGGGLDTGKTLFHEMLCFWKRYDINEDVYKIFVEAGAKPPALMDFLRSFVRSSLNMQKWEVKWYYKKYSKEGLVPPRHREREASYWITGVRDDAEYEDDDEDDENGESLENLIETTRSRKVDLFSRTINLIGAKNINAGDVIPNKIHADLWTNLDASPLRTDMHISMTAQEFEEAKRDASDAVSRYLKAILKQPTTMDAGLDDLDIFVMRAAHVRNAVVEL